VSVTPAQQAAGAGTLLEYSVSVRNNDTGCGTSAFTLSVTAPSGWGATLSGAAMQLGQAASGTVTLRLTSPPGAIPNTYAASVVAQGVTVSSSASAGYVVNAPAGGGGGGQGVTGSFSDAFDRPDAPALDNGWSPVSGTLGIVAREARTPATRTIHASVRPDLVGAAQTASASFASADNNSAPQFGVYLRYQNSTNHYRCYRAAGANSFVLISKVVGGKETVLRYAAMPNPVRNSFFTLSCQASGTTLTLRINGTVKATVVDSTFASGTVGLGLGSAAGLGAAHRADNFSATVQ
jgi:hypothetical protein